jgi:hypothetical protein
VLFGRLETGVKVNDGETEAARGEVYSGGGRGHCPGDTHVFHFSLLQKI